MRDKDLDRPIKDNLETLSDLLSQFIGQSSSVPATDINTLLTTLAYTRDLKKSIEDVLSVIKTFYTQMQTETVPNAMENLGIDSAKVGKYNFTLGHVLHASIPADKREKGFEWLRNNNLGDIIREEANQKTLSSALSRYLEETGRTPPEDAISMHTEKTISIRKTA